MMIYRAPPRSKGNLLSDRHYEPLRSKGNLLSDQHYRPVEPWQRFGTEDASQSRRVRMQTPLDATYITKTVDTSHITKIRPDEPSQKGTYWDDKSISRRESEYR